MSKIGEGREQQDRKPRLSFRVAVYIYRKIPKMSPGAYIFQRPFLRGLYSEGLMYRGKFAFQNRFGYLVVGRKFTVFALFNFVFEGTVSKYKPLGGLYVVVF